ARRRGDRRPAGDGRAPPEERLLEVLPAHPPPGPRVEPQARAPRLLRAPAQPAAAHQAPGADAAPAAPGGAQRVDGIWAVDFMSDALYGGRKFRTLNVIDEGNPEGLTIEAAVSIPSVRVIRVLEELVLVHGKPAAIRLDNGPELTAEVLHEWCER